jgi:ketosteroid isomerase-like protein
VLTCVENILTADEDDTDDDSALFAGAKGVATNVFRRTPAGWRLWVRHGSPVISNTADDADE